MFYFLKSLNASPNRRYSPNVKNIKSPSIHINQFSWKYCGNRWERSDKISAKAARQWKFNLLNQFSLYLSIHCQHRGACFSIDWNMLFIREELVWDVSPKKRDFSILFFWLNCCFPNSPTWLIDVVSYRESSKQLSKKCSNVKGAGSRNCCPRPPTSIMCGCINHQMINDCTEHN